MSEGVWCIPLFALAALAIYLAWDIALTCEGQKMRKDFEKRFPDKCAYCAFIWWGITHGHEKPDARPKPHACKENMQRFKEAR